MYTILNVVLGPEIEVTFVCNESQVHEVAAFIPNCEGSAVDIIEAVEASFDCRLVTPQYVDPFNWRPTNEGPHQEAGICPVCGSPDLRYGASSFDSLQECYPWTCHTCKSSGEEWYDLRFIEHTNIVKEDI